MAHAIAEREAQKLDECETCAASNEQQVRTLRPAKMRSARRSRQLIDARWPQVLETAQRQSTAHSTALVVFRFGSVS